MRSDHRTDSARRVVARLRQAKLDRVANSARLVMRAEALAFTKTAAESAPEDLGLRAFYRRLSAAFAEDPTGTFSYADLAAMREPTERQFPKSAVREIVEQIVDKSLSDIAPQHRDAYMRDIARLANLVTDQASYEDVVQAHGLDGDNLHCIRARAMIRALAMPASKIDEEEEEASEKDAQLESAPAEMSVPHDEATEQVQETSSPNTGKPLVLEVAPKAPEGPIPTDEDSMHSDLMPVESEGPFSVVGQLGDFAPSDDMPTMGEHDVMVTVDDPTQPGSKIDIILRPHEMEDDLGDMSDEDYESRMPPMDEPKMDGEPDNPFAPKAAVQHPWVPFTVISATEAESETIARFKARSMSAALRRLASVAMRHGDQETLQAPVSVADRPAARGKYAIVDLGETQIHVIASDVFDVDVKAQHDMQGAPSLPDVSTVLSDAAAGEGSIAKTSRVTPDVARARAAELGITAAAIESMLYDTFEVRRAGWRITVTTDDTIEVGAIGKRAQVFPIRKMDDAIANFQAVVAALTPVEKKAYVLSFVVPGKDEATRRVNARKVFADARKVADPIHMDADLASGTVLLYYETAPEESARNRIASVCRDKYGIMQIEAQARPMPNSPYTGTPPVISQPAGAPAQPMQAPQQQMQTGTNAMKDMIDRHTDPMKPVAQLDAEPTPPTLDPLLDASGAPAGMPAGAPMGGPSSMEMSGALSPEDQQAVAASLTHYRNKKMGPLGASSQFTRDYGEFLDRFGKEGDDSRVATETEIIKMMGEIWMQPAVLKAASLPVPAVNQRVMPAGGGVSMPAKLDLAKVPDEMTLKPGPIESQHDMQGGKTKDTDLGKGTEGGRESF